MKNMKIEKIDKNGNVKVYEYDPKKYYITHKNKHGYYLCPNCLSYIINYPSVITKHNNSKKCSRSAELKLKEKKDENSTPTN